MTPDERDRMQSLCEQIVKEENGEKFTKLVEELSDLLDHNERAFEGPQGNGNGGHLSE
jgi:hypothetical protein